MARGAVRLALLLNGAIALMLVVCACKRVEAGSPADAARPRIVTIGGAVTETAFALGAGDDIVGTDTSSVYPEAATKLPQVGYQRTIAAEGVLALRPTLVLAAPETGPATALDQIRAAGVPVNMVPSEPTIDGVREKITFLARALGREADAKPIVARLDERVAEAGQALARTTSRPKVLALFARGTGLLLVFGRNTAADSMIRLAGGVNSVTEFEGTKALTPEVVIAAAPEVLLVPSSALQSLGGLDGLLALPGLSLTPAAKERRVVAIDDLPLLGFGPRTGDALLELTTRLHPELSSP